MDRNISPLILARFLLLSGVCVFSLLLCTIDETDADAVSKYVEYAEDGYDDRKHGPSEWHEQFPLCGSGHLFEIQSPLDIPERNIVMGRSPLTRIETNYVPFTGQLSNTGFTIKVEASHDFTNVTQTMSVGSAPYETRNRAIQDDITWSLLETHFHWSAYSDIGSEHAIDGIYSPLEMHLVHTNSELSDTATIAESAMGLCVIGFLFEIGEESAALKPITDLVKKIRFMNDKTNVKLDLNKLFDEVEDMSDYFAYAGSLTTPPCFESVTWIVMRERLTVSQEQLQNFKRMMGNTNDAAVDDWMPLLTNHRPVQGVHQRVIFAKNGAINQYPCT